MNSEEMERFGGGATLPSEVKLAKNKSLHIFEEVNKRHRAFRGSLTEGKP